MKDRDGFQDDDAPLSGLPAEAAPPPDLEDRVVRALDRQGLLRAGRKQGRLALLAVAIAAVLAAFAAGIAIGRRPPPAARADSSPRFVLFLEPLPDELRGETSRESERIAEYRVWAGRLRSAGRTVAGEKLRPGSRVVGPAAGSPEHRPPDALGGFFVISAKDIEEAAEIARDSPHVRHGGRIVVRAIDPT